MTFAAPTSGDLKQRFPDLFTSPNLAVEAALTEAARMVDNTWLNQEDFTEGRLLYAAHVLTLDGHGTGAEAEMAKSGALGFTTMKSGNLTLSRSTSGVDKGSENTLTQTQYGRRFLRILNMNQCGPVAVTS